MASQPRNVPAHCRAGAIIHPSRRTDTVSLDLGPSLGSFVHIVFVYSRTLVLDRTGGLPLRRRDISSD